MKYERNEEIIVRKNMNINKDPEKYNKKWSAEEEEYLKENQNELSLLELSRVLKRTPWGIANKKRLLKKQKGRD